VRFCNSLETNATDGAKTARTLHIHRSTLYYRLDRIHSLTGTGTGTGSGAARNDLHAALRVARLAGLLHGR
jgi:DNA-binding PucR family transcriptional regulator